MGICVHPSSQRCPLLACVLVAMAGCTDAALYRGGVEAAGGDRLTLDGTVCTDEPTNARFPTRVVFVVDQSETPLNAWDQTEGAGTQSWVEAVRSLVNLAAASRELSFAMIGVAGTPTLLTPGFTRNPAELDVALGALHNLLPCTARGCRDVRGAIGLVRSLIEGDAVTLTAGELARVQYLVVLVIGGMPVPMVPACVCPDPIQYPDCCTDADQCVADQIADSATPLDQPTCQRETLVDDVVALQEAVEEAGAASLRFHTFQLEAGDVLPDDGIDEPALVRDLLTQMAFAGNGVFAAFDRPASVSFRQIDVLASAGALEVKGLVVTNVNALPTVDGTAVDSDADGLPDVVEDGDCVSPALADTDGDGLTDMIDRLLGFDPCTAEPPETWPTCVGVGPADDSDADGLRDCEELLIGTNPTLVDSDGDVLPDRMEVSAGTRFLEPDALLDDDGDGVSNGEEVKGHTDPRSSDAGRHLGEAYRYELVNEGVRRLLTAQNPRSLTGIVIDSVSGDTTAGIGNLTFTLGPPAQLSWKDPLDGEPGPAVDVSEGGTFTLLSSSAISLAFPQDRSVQVTVDANILPLSDGMEALRVDLTQRRCLRYQVRNVRLVETRALNVGLPNETRAGRNTVLVYFGESPAGRLETPGLFRVVDIPVTFTPPTRTPSDPILFISDDEFTQTGF